MVGGSILVIYEGDPARLAEAIDHTASTALKELGGTSDSAEEVSKPIPVYSVKLIDFAHTILQEGLGPDEGVLLGVDTTISLLEGRINEVQEALAA